MRFIALGLLATLLLSGCAGAGNATVTVTVTRDPSPWWTTSSSPQAPDMGFSKDNNARTITVIKAPVGSESLRYVAEFRWSGECAVVNLNGASPARPPTDADTVTAGDVLQTDCAANEAITFTHVPSGTVVYQGTFT